MQLETITLEAGGSHDSGRCECCGNMTRRVWGYLYDHDVPTAAYYVTWTAGRIDHGANFDLVLGKWGEGASPKDRSFVAAEFRWVPSGRSFMVIDAEGRPLATPGDLADKAL